MRTAILFTGQLRTIQRTAKIIRENLIEPNDADAFLYCEERLADQQYGSQERGSLDHVRSEWGSSIKSIEVADSDPHYWSGKDDGDAEGQDAGKISRDEYRRERASALAEDNLAGRLFYEATGAALEYHQLRCAYEAMCAEEERRGERYDIVCRSRFDVITFRKLIMANYFDPSLFWENIFKFKKEARNQGRTSAELLYAVLISGGDETMAHQILQGEMADVGYCGKIDGKNFGDCLRANSGGVMYDKYLQILKGIDLKEACEEEYTADFLRNIPGVFAIRYNVIYFTKREHMEKLVRLADTVGEYVSGNNLDWCSENQFGMHLLSNGLLSLNYHSNIDEEYLVSIDLGSFTVNKNNEIEKLTPKYLTWACIRKNKSQAERGWSNLSEIQTKNGAVEINT